MTIGKDKKTPETDVNGMTICGCGMSFMTSATCFTKSEYLSGRREARERRFKKKQTPEADHWFASRSPSRLAPTQEHAHVSPGPHAAGQSSLEV